MSLQQDSRTCQSVAELYGLGSSPLQRRRDTPRHTFAPTRRLPHTHTHTLVQPSFIIIIFLFKCMDCYFAEGPSVKWGFRVDRCVDIFFSPSLERFLIGHSDGGLRGFSEVIQPHAECINSLSVSVPAKLEYPPRRIFMQTRAICFENIL